MWFDVYIHMLNCVHYVFDFKWIYVSFFNNLFIDFPFLHTKETCVPQSSPHLLHKLEMLLLNLLRFSGVIFTLIGQMYCRSFRRVFPVCD